MAAPAHMLVAMHERCCDWGAAQAVVEEFGAAGIQPDGLTLGALIQGLWTCGSAAGCLLALRAFERACRSGVFKCAGARGGAARGGAGAAARGRRQLECARRGQEGFLPYHQGGARFARARAHKWVRSSDVRLTCRPASPSLTSPPSPAACPFRLSVSIDGDDTRAVFSLPTFGAGMALVALWRLFQEMSARITRCAPPPHPALPQARGRSRGAIAPALAMRAAVWWSWSLTEATAGARHSRPRAAVAFKLRQRASPDASNPAAACRLADTAAPIKNARASCLAPSGTVPACCAAAC
jgi:hypothetical protein